MEVETLSGPNNMLLTRIQWKTLTFVSFFALPMTLKQWPKGVGILFLSVSTQPITDILPKKITRREGKRRYYPQLCPPPSSVE